MFHIFIFLYCVHLIVDWSGTIYLPLLNFTFQILNAETILEFPQSFSSPNREFFVISSNFDFILLTSVVLFINTMIVILRSGGQKIDEIITRILAPPPFSFCHLGSVSRADIPLLMTFNRSRFIFFTFQVLDSCQFSLHLYRGDFPF